MPMPQDRKPRILCIGIPVRDLTFQIEALPVRGSKASASAYREIIGGNALNAAIAVSRLGGHASLAGPIGDSREASGTFLFDQLAQEGIDARHLVPMAGLVTPVSSVMIEPDGERTIATFRDPALWMVCLPDTDLLLADCDAVLVENRCSDFAVELCAEARRRGIPVIVGVDRPMASGDGLLAASSHLIFSSESLQATAGVACDTEALAALAAQTPSFLAGTRGPRGTLWLRDGRLRETPAFAVESVDTLGAGDIFHGAFSLAVTEGRSPEDALRFASAAAALKCARHGGAFACPQRAEVEQFLGDTGRYGPATNGLT